MADTEKVDDLSSITVSSKVLSRMLGIGDRRIRGLAEEGVLVKASHGRYKLQESVHNYILNLKISKGTQFYDPSLEDELNVEKEKALHERVKRQIAELKLSLMKGDVHKSSDVEAVMFNMLSNFKSRCLSIPSKLTPKLVNRSDKGYINELLTNEVNHVLTELSDYNPSDFYGEEYVDNEEDIEELVMDYDAD